MEEWLRLSEDLVLCHRYDQSSQVEVPEIRIQDEYGSIKSHGKFEDQITGAKTKHSTQFIPNRKMFDFFDTKFNHLSYSKICVKYHFFRRDLVY